jgi:hypothetical protein
MLAAAAKTDKIITYSAYEKRMIRELQEATPNLARSLAELESNLIDLLPVVRITSTIPISGSVSASRLSSIHWYRC